MLINPIILACRPAHRAGTSILDGGKKQKPVPRTKIRAKQDKETKCEAETTGKGKKKENGKVKMKRVNAIMLDWERGDPPGLPPL